MTLSPRYCRETIQIPQVQHAIPCGVHWELLQFALFPRHIYRLFIIIIHIQWFRLVICFYSGFNFLTIYKYTINSHMPMHVYAMIVTAIGQWGWYACPNSLWFVWVQREQPIETIFRLNESIYYSCTGTLVVGCLFLCELTSASLKCTIVYYCYLLYTMTMPSPEWYRVLFAAYRLCSLEAVGHICAVCVVCVCMAIMPLFTVYNIQFY